MGFSIRLNGEVQIGLDGERLEGLQRSDARAIARELEQVWGRELAGDRLEVVDDGTSDDAPMVLRGSVLVAVERLSNDDVHRYVAATLDDEAREWAAGRTVATGDDIEREFLALYAQRYRELHGEWPAF